MQERSGFHVSLPTVFQPLESVAGISRFKAPQRIDSGNQGACQIVAVTEIVSLCGSHLLVGSDVTGDAIGQLGDNRTSSVISVIDRRKDVNRWSVSEFPVPEFPEFPTGKSAVTADTEGLLRDV